MSLKIQPENAVAYSYQRFSSVEQRKGDSIRRQTQSTENWCARNKIHLDDNLRFVDEGVSSFRGKHRSSDKFALGYFLSLVQSGRIPPGSYLVLESLDRLSREDVDEALRLLLSLTGAGIRVVQLSPVEVIYEKPVDPTKLIIGIMEMSRGNSESKMKSERIGAAWEGMRKRARETKKAITGCCPRWLKRDGDGFKVIPERVAAVRRIFELSAEGNGINAIIKKLIAEGHKPFGRNGKWINSSMGHLMNNRAVLGEYQPYKDKKKHGEPIQNFYPAIIDEALFYRVKASLKQRLRAVSRASDGSPLPRGGRKPYETNMFAGLMFNAVDGDSIQYHWFRDKRQGASYGYGRYVNSMALTAQATLVSFPIRAIEEGVLSCLAEIDPMEVLPRHDKTEDDVMSLSAQMGEIEAQLAKIEERLATPGESVDLLVNAANRLQAKRKEIGARLSEARMKASNPQSEAWGTCHTLITALNGADDREAAKVRLRSAMRRIVSKMVCLFIRNGRRQIACIQFHFVGSEKIRTVFIQHRGGFGNQKEKTPPHTSYTSMIDDMPGKIDLANPADLKVVSDVLAKMCEPENWQKAVEPDLLTCQQKIKERKRIYMKRYNQEVRKPRRAEQGKSARPPAKGKKRTG